MAMQYPAAAMVMQHQMMYPQQHHYMPYHHQPYQQPQQQQQQQQQQPQQQQQSQSQIQGLGDENRTIWVGDLQQWMDEAYLNSCFLHTGEVSTVKVIRNKQTAGQSESMGFVEFLSHAAAEKVLAEFQCTGTVMPNTEQTFRLNGLPSARVTSTWIILVGSDLSMFVGDLAPDVTDNNIARNIC
ncbi:RNA-binding protein 47B [Actinidia rufa]|uniref:RNA-binding protein 47B n=1 Tax=Actinidia rufa TaxID=165716 RepID=A0A7J0F9Y9_9ERIC|nr:RNA-binding protein 47B [Actinidia rufa]